VHQGIRAIDFGAAKFVLVVGVEQMTRTQARDRQEPVEASYLPEDGEVSAASPACSARSRSLFPEIWRPVRRARHDRGEEHKNGVANPTRRCARIFGFDFCRSRARRSYVAGPLKRTDCSLVSDGAAALVLTDSETAKRLSKAVNVRATAHAQDSCDVQARHPAVRGLHGRLAARAAEGRCAALDLSFVETHDCFTVAELIEYEAMGLTPKGQGGPRHPRRLDPEGRQAAGQSLRRIEGEGHPIGATGVSMHVMTAMQLTVRRRRACSSGHPSSAASSTWAVRGLRTTSRAGAGEVA